MFVSIIIPTYNRPEFLKRLLGSIASQTFQDFEVIVVDDASKCGAAYQKLIEEFQKTIGSVIYLRNASNRGAPFCRNRGVRAAKYDLLAFVDDDDEWLPTKLEKQVEIFKRAPEKIGLVYTWAKEVDEEDRILHEYRAVIEGPALKAILTNCFIVSASALVRKEALQAAGFFDERFPSCQDWDMWTRIFKLGYQVGVVKSIECVRHKHGQPSIGHSSQAARGHRMYYQKHLAAILRYTSIINWIRICKNYMVIHLKLLIPVK